MNPEKKKARKEMELKVRELTENDIEALDRRGAELWEASETEMGPMFTLTEAELNLVLK